jgi:hypothetical protein
MSNEARTMDYTKTKRYAYIDLASKVLSAIALVALGIAGWMLQMRTENARQRSEEFERQERRYLPMLRSLSVLELEIEVALKEVERSETDENAKVVNYDAATKLRFIAESVFMPDGDPLVSLRAPDTILVFGRLEERINMPLKASALMYAELIRMRYFFGDAYGDATLRLEPQQKSISFNIDNRKIAHQQIAPDSIPAWQIWLKDRTITLSRVRILPMNLLLEDLRFATSEVIQSVLISHVDLGDRYIQIRDEVEKSRQSISNRNAQSSEVLNKPITK